MLKDIKNILYNEVKDEIDRYKSLKNKIEELQQKIDDAWQKDRNSVDENCQMQIVPIKRYTFFQKHITKIKEYLQYIKDRQNYENTLSEYDRKSEENRLLREKLELEKEELEKKCFEIEEKGIREKYEKIKTAKTLKELGLSFEETVKILIDNGMTVVLDESDRVITENESEFDKDEDFILVHKTNYSPTNDEVKSNKMSGVKTKYSIQFDDEEFSYEFFKGRNTVHLCQNGEVTSHEYGNFDGRKYAVLIPFKSLKRDNLVSFRPEDTFFEKKVDTTEGYILCPIDEVEDIKNRNPNTNVIGYKGECVDGFANSLLSMLGYKYEGIGKHSWHSDEDRKKHNSFMQSNNELKYCAHDGSRQECIDTLVDKYNRIMGFTKSILENKKQGKIYDVDRLTENLFSEKTKVLAESGTARVEYNDKIGPRFTDIEGYSIFNSEKYYLKDIIGDEEYKDDEDDSRDSNEKFLLYQLKKQFNINIPDDVAEALEYCGTGWVRDREKELENLKSKINDEQTIELLNKMIESGEIEKLEDAKDVLFVRTIIQKVYERTVDKEEKKPEDDEVEI